jgi:hypothetical protein
LSIREDRVRLCGDQPVQEVAVKYMIQIYGNISRDQFEAMSDDEKQATYAAWGAVNQHPGLTPGLELADPSTATTVRVRGGKMLTTDGPFIETKEALGGYFILEADDLDAAIELAGRIPTAQAVEVRPIVER